MEFMPLDINNLPIAEVIANNSEGDTLRGFIYSWPIKRGGIFCTNAKKKLDLNNGGHYKPVKKDKTTVQ